MQLSSTHPTENFTGDVVPCVFSSEAAPPQNGQGFRSGVRALEFCRIGRFMVGWSFYPPPSSVTSAVVVVIVVLVIMLVMLLLIIAMATMAALLLFSA